MKHVDDMSREECLADLDTIAEQWGLKKLSGKTRESAGISRLRRLIAKIRHDAETILGVLK
jgi:hypothetical protein